MSLQQILQSLLRSRLYRTRVAIQLAGGQTHQGRVADLRYDGSRSVVLLAASGAAGPSTELLLSRIVHVEGLPAPLVGPAPDPSEAA